MPNELSPALYLDGEDLPWDDRYGIAPPRRIRRRPLTTHGIDTREPVEEGIKRATPNFKVGERVVVGQARRRAPLEVVEVYANRELVLVRLAEHENSRPYDVEAKRLVRCETSDDRPIP